MLVRPITRIIAYSLVSCLPTLQVLWMLMIIPAIMKHNFHFSEENVALGVSFMYNANYLGLLIGCFIWPTIGPKLYKRTSLLVGMTLAMIFNTLMALSTDFRFICLMMFFVGLSMNTSSVGKDFIFEFVSEPIHRQYAFSSSGAFKTLCLFGEPYLGYLMYEFFDKDFSKCVLVVSAVFFVSLVFFFCVFVLDYDVHKQIEADRDPGDEEEAKKLVEKEKEGVQHKSLWQVFKLAMTPVYTRTLMTCYILVGAVTKCSNVFVILFSEETWSNGGLHISPRVLSLVAMLSIFPSISINMFSPLFVPKRLSYFNFFRSMMFLAMLALLVIPCFRHMYKERSVHNLLVYFVISIVFWSNTKAYSPTVNNLINSEFSKHDRTSLNSIIFFLEMTLAGFILQICSLVYRFVMFSKHGEELGSWRSLIPFSFLSLFILTPILLLSPKNYQPRDRKPKEIPAAS